MRAAILLWVGITLSATGCSYHIAASGKDLGTVTTREQIHAEFGPPVAGGVTEGKPYEDFRTHRKIADDFLSIQGARLASGYTLGLAEVVLWPAVCLDTARQVVFGQDLRFVYDEKGDVTAAVRNGEYIVGNPRLSRRIPSPQAASGEASANPAEPPRTPPVPVRVPSP
jgi:hypothetical protein